MDKIANQSEGEVQEILREFAALYGSRGIWEIHWQEIAERILPSASQSFQGNFRSPGEKRTFQLFDSTAQVALTRFAAILDSLLTPRNQTWHSLMVDNEELAKNRDVRMYFEDVNRKLFKYRYNERANFSSQNQQNYTSLGGFGTGCMFTDELWGGPGLRYRNIHLGEIYFAENHQGVVDKAYRKFKLTARQAKQKWGENLPSEILGAMLTNSEMEYDFLHCVKPREKDYDPNRKDFKGMKYASYYIAFKGEKKLSEGGYHTFPYAISRYEQSLGEVYGRSPAMDVLPAVKTLNEQKKTALKAGHRMVDPVLLIHDDGSLDSFSLKPGAANYGGVTADGRPLVHTLPTGDYRVSKEQMEDERKLINDSFLVNLFQVLTEAPQMTATEVLERTREKGILLAPTVGRQQSEYLGPLIEREIDVLSMQNLLPPMPAVLKEARGEYKIQYDSPLSRSQRAEEASGLQRTVETALQVVQITQNPEPLDYFDWDVIMPEVASIQGVPFRWMKTVDAVMKARQSRAQQAQIQQAVQAAPAISAVAKVAGPQKAG